MARHFTPSERAAKKAAVLEFLNAAAENNQPVPSCEEIGRMIRTRHQVVLTFIRELELDGIIRQTVRARSGRSNGRVVTICATGKTTAPRVKSAAHLGIAAKRLADLDRGARTEAKAIDERIYGGILPDVQFLRHRGWVITSEQGGYRVGNQLIGAADIVAKAQRERRLAGVA